MLALGIIIPVLPRLVVDFMGGDTEAAAEIFGLFGTAWALMQFLFSPIQGALSDRFGRRPVILISNLGARPRLHPDGAGADHRLAVRRPRHLRHHRGEHLDGLCLHRRRDAAGAARRALRAAGRRRSARASCSVPRSAASPAASTPRLPFWIAAGLSLANALYGVLVLPESLPRERRAPFAWRRANPLGSLKLLRSHAELLGLASVNFLGNLAHAVLPSVSVLYMAYRYGWDERIVGFTMAGVGVCAIIVQGGVVGARDHALRRARDADHRARLRGRGLCGLRAGDDRHRVLARHSADGAVGTRKPGGDGPDEPPCQRLASRARCRAPTAASWASPT